MDPTDIAKRATSLLNKRISLASRLVCLPVFVLIPPL